MSESTAKQPPEARFVSGSTMRHVVVMTSTGSIGLMALFLVDFADMYFLSLLGEVEVAAAIGYAGSILFFTTSIGIGLAIATSALVARAIGAGERERSRQLASNALVFGAAVATVLAIAIWPMVPALLSVLGAEDRAHTLATGYLRIIIPSMPVLAVAMSAAALLRSVGDAKRAMYVTLSGGAVNAILDPIFIFVLELGVDGAAMASVASRFVIVAVGLHGIVAVHDLWERPRLMVWLGDIRAISSIALPAMLTNVATPFGNAYVTSEIATFGDGPVAGWAIIGRVVPVAFGTIFALSGAIGPILGQNIGAARFDRVRSAFRDALIFCIVYVAIVWGLMAIAHTHIAQLFGVGGAAAELIAMFSLWLCPTFVFFGALFISNAAYNNLGRPHYSTLFNWGRATLGTIPFVLLGSHFYGAPGALAGNFAGGAAFGIIAVYFVFRLITRLEQQGATLEQPVATFQRRFTLWPFTTPRG